MDNHSYILVNDDCEHCQYVTNAFTLLKFPLKKITTSEFVDNNTLLSDALSVIVCKNIEENQGKTLDKVLENTGDVSFISFDIEKQVGTKLAEFRQTLPLKFSINELKTALSKITRHQKAVANPESFSHPAFDRLVGRSKYVRELKSFVSQVADSDATVLILGESGTGKDVIASAIHQLSHRKKGPLVPINCGAIPGELMESELFGHEKGAFTGALTRRPGRFEMANNGTLFLDEIGDMPMPMQVKLLRVLQDRLVERVGSCISIEVNVRVIAATNKNLTELIEQNLFREDLFYRLNVFPIQVPSLSQRNEDIPALIDFHLDKIYERIHHKVAFTERALEILSAYSWPGNIRELANFLERMVILHHDCVIDEKDLDAVYKQKSAPIVQTLTLPNTPLDIKEFIAKIEQDLIASALEKSNGIINAAADYLSLGRSALVEKMKKYNLQPAD